MQFPSSKTSGFIKDLERLTHKNADLCNSLAATQYSRSILEREIIILKRTLLEERREAQQTIEKLRQNNQVRSFDHQKLSDVPSEGDNLTKVLSDLEMANKSLMEQLTEKTSKLKSVETQLNSSREHSEQLEIENSSLCCQLARVQRYT